MDFFKQRGVYVPMAGDNQHTADFERHTGDDFKTLFDAANNPIVPATNKLQASGAARYVENDGRLELYSSQRGAQQEWQAVHEVNFAGVPQFGLAAGSGAIEHDGATTYNIIMSRFTLTGKLDLHGLAWYQHDVTLTQGYIRPVLFKFDAKDWHAMPLGGTCGTYDTMANIGNQTVMHICPEKLTLWPGDYYIGLQGVNANVVNCAVHASLDSPQVFTSDWCYVNWNTNSVPAGLKITNEGTAAGSVNRAKIERPWVVTVSVNVPDSFWDQVVVAT